MTARASFSFAAIPKTLVAVVADIKPLRSIRGPNPAPAIVVASVEVVSAATVSEAIEAIMVMEEAVVWERRVRECGMRHGGKTSRSGGPSART